MFFFKGSGGSHPLKEMGDFCAPAVYYPRSNKKTRYFKEKLSLVLSSREDAQVCMQILYLWHNSGRKGELSDRTANPVQSV